MTVSFLTAGGGAGDAKIATAIGLLLGVERGVAALVYTYLSAAAFALVYVTICGALGALAWALTERLGLVIIPCRCSLSALEKRQLLKRKIRMGPFFAVGALAAVLEGGLG